MFGNTLTKLRNRLGIKTLTSLAELKMHIRDEHLCNKETKEHMKRFFGKSSAPPESTAPPPPPPPPTEEMAMDNMTNIDPELQALQASRDDDDDGGEQMYSSEGISIKIAQLFNFQNRNWIPANKRSASRRLDEELELYELFDLDAQGEEDMDIKIDHTLDSVLHI
ncbi:hypothetical protein EDB83DRAFT_2518857 [Lactarius deliciosus]|nr:hypothetical protein EDB83DRAFT_2518857 [Lactarius deliciosus]